MKQLEELKEKLGNDLNLEMLSTREAYITGDTEIEALSEEEIAVVLGKVKIIFSGSGLKIEYYNADGIKISGKIEKTEFIHREL